MGTTQAESVGAPLPEQATGPALVGDRSAIGTGCGSGPSGVTASGAARSVPPITVLALVSTHGRSPEAAEQVSLVVGAGAGVAAPEPGVDGGLQLSQAGALAGADGALGLAEDRLQGHQPGALGGQE